jgi:hypothetical protein
MNQRVEKHMSTGMTHAAAVVNALSDILYEVALGPEWPTRAASDSSFEESVAIVEEYAATEVRRAKEAQ